MGKVQQELANYDKARIAFKKMLQLSWLTKMTDYEIKAYNYIAT